MIVAQFLKIYNLKATKTMLLKKIIWPKLVYKIKKTKLQIINSNLTFFFSPYNFKFSFQFFN